MKNIKLFEEFDENIKESVEDRIKTSDFVQSIRDLKDNGFEELCEEESVKNALSIYLGNEYGNHFEDFSINYESFPYEIVDVQVEKGDYKDEETTTGIFKRLSDGKYFALVIHDAGQIGPSTLTVMDWMYEVKPKKVTVTKWS
jgi:hypothetical protein